MSVISPIQGNIQITPGAPGAAFGALANSATQAPSSLDDIFEKYFDVRGDVSNHSKEFVDLISRLPCVGDNFQTIKLYKFLVDGKSKEFKDYLNNKLGGSRPRYEFATDSDSGVYQISGDKIGLSVGGVNKITIS